MEWVCNCLRVWYLEALKWPLSKASSVHLLPIRVGHWGVQDIGAKWDWQVHSIIKRLHFMGSEFIYSIHSLFLSIIYQVIAVKLRLMSLESDVCWAWVVDIKNLYLSGWITWGDLENKEGCSEMLSLHQLHPVAQLGISWPWTGWMTITCRGAETQCKYLSVLSCHKCGTE